MQNGFDTKDTAGLVYLLKHDWFVADQPEAEDILFSFEVSSSKLLGSIIGRKGIKP